jgi:thiosulfate/3-mercaptopyruvate sulfurtransferase
MSTCTLLVSFSSLSAAEAPQESPAAGATYARPELLVEPRNLSAAGPDVVVLDARSEAAYAKGHIPGAVRVDHDAWKGAFKNGGDSPGWSRRIGELGIGPQTQVVIYDDALSKDAARIWWILRYWGVDKAALLNGGWHGWQAPDRMAEQPVAKPIPKEFKAQPRAARLALKAALLKQLKDTQHTPQIVDARSEKEYCGDDTRSARRSGAMPGAKHLEWSDLIDSKSQRFKPAAELKQMFSDAGIDLKKRTVTHCQTGGRSSVMAFGMELMGADDVANYYASWAEWGNAADTPIEKPPAKPRSRPKPNR